MLMLDVNTILSMAIKNGKDTIHKGHAEDASSSYFYGTPGYKLFFFFFFKLQQQSKVHKLLHSTAHTQHPIKWVNFLQK